MFCNNRMREFFGRYAKEMNTHVQGFDPKGVIGANLSLFQPVLGEVLGSLNEIAGTREAQVSIGPRILEIAVTPVRNEDGERIGTVFEWVDKTDELRAGKEIDAVVAAAVNGDFTKRADLATAPTALANMGEQINKLADSVEQSVSETSRIVRSLSEGDLTERMQGNFHGVFEELSQNVNAMAERFSDLIGQIASMSQSVSDGTGQILSGSEDLASRAEQQASSLEETAATMEEMSASIKSNAEGSTRAKSLASEAATRADKGGQVVRDAVSSMGGIEESSKKIADIISVIDGIAFQTNLLALNAAVEAARAGDAGKGFAVVASEVRALAQRSSEASNDIRQLIDASAVQVADGVRLVTETGEFLESIVTSIDEVDKAIKKIAEASIEQASGAQEISTTVNHMDQMTQENASLADRSAATSRSLASGAQSLQQLVAFFKINETGREAALDAAWQDAEAEIAATAIAATAAVEAPAKPVPAAFKAASGGESWTDF
ncbi:MAG: methyl-accepting chemotaxis protein [Pseudomonadota bacterium]